MRTTDQLKAGITYLADRLRTCHSARSRMLLLDKINFLRREHLLQIEYERRHRRPPVSVGCKACREENPVENTYCDNCGYPLDPRGHYVH